MTDTTLDTLAEPEDADPMGDARDAVTGFADDADVLFCRRGLRAADLRFNFLQ